MVRKATFIGREKINVNKNNFNSVLSDLARKLTSRCRIRWPAMAKRRTSTAFYDIKDFEPGRLPGKSATPRHAGDAYLLRDLNQSAR
ncbi:MAG: hypothetical protein ACLTFW_28105 [Klebsiella pneumoniae]